MIYGECADLDELGEISTHPGAMAWVLRNWAKRSQCLADTVHFHHSVILLIRSIRERFEQLYFWSFMQFKVIISRFSVTLPLAALSGRPLSLNILCNHVLWWSFLVCLFLFSIITLSPFSITALFTFFHSFFLPLSLWQQRSDSLSLIESRWARKTGRGEGPIKVWSLSSFLTCFYSPPAWALHSTVCVRIYRCFLNQTVSKIMLWLIYSHSDANETCLICLKSLWSHVSPADWHLVDLNHSGNAENA